MTGATWNVVSFVDLTYFHDEFETIKNSIYKFREICFDSKYNERRQISIGSECKSVIIQLEKRIVNVDDRNNIIFHNYHRVRRAAFNIVGYVASELFGVLDSRFATDYANDMKKLMHNDEHLLELLKNHSSVMESTMHILKRVKLKSNTIVRKLTK